MLLVFSTHASWFSFPLFSLQGGFVFIADVFRRGTGLVFAAKGIRRGVVADFSEFGLSKSCRCPF